MKLKTLPNNVVVHTPTEEEAKELLAILHANGYKWHSGDSLIKQNYWYVYKHESAYSIKNDGIGFSSCTGYKVLGVKILSLAEFKRMYCEEDKPQPKFKEGDRVVIQESYYKEELHGQIGVVINMPSPFSYYVEIDKTIYQASAKDLEPYTEPETKPTEDMETKELNLVELLQGHEGDNANEDKLKKIWIKIQAENLSSKMEINLGDSQYCLNFQENEAKVELLVGHSSVNVNVETLHK